MRERLIYNYGGLWLITRDGMYEVHENGEPLAKTDSRPLADKIYFARAKRIASERVLDAPERGYFGLTPAGRRALYGAAPEAKKAAAPAEPEKRREVWRKPTVEEIAAYCIERGNGLDAEEIFDHYESNGWMVGKTHMKDWRAAVRTCEKKHREWAARAERTSRPAEKRVSRWVGQTNPEESSLRLDGAEEELMRHTPVFSKKANCQTSGKEDA